MVSWIVKMNGTVVHVLFFFSQIIDLDEDQPFGNSSNRWMRVSSPLSYFDEEHVGTRGF